MPGDAVILEAIEPSIQLDRYLNDFDMAARSVPDRRRLADQLVELIYQLGGAKLGHVDLHLGNILLSSGRLYLLDGYAVRHGGLKLRHVLMLGHAAGRWATRTEIVRGWRRLMSGQTNPPIGNPLSSRLASKFLRRTRGENPYFGTLAIGKWRGHFVKGLKLPRWWTPASALRVSQADWQREWPALLNRVESGQTASVIKRTRSGEVLADVVHVGGVDVQVIIKRPRRKTLWRRINAFARPGKARRSWFKAWKLIIRGFPTEWPLLLMERRRAGYTCDSILVVARVCGPTLANADLDALDPAAREMLFRRLGRTIRRVEQEGFSHFDSKSSNWIVMTDRARGPIPVMIDVDGVRHYRWDGFGIRRLLRSMKSHPQYTRLDSLHLCQGYAPYARIAEEEA
jgi:tRNA A-37 threonylcarbamoyl transferase component Bud32